jgi:8-oxo-dGTP pyrophosphatase MutT (NUDIX family)
LIIRTIEDFLRNSNESGVGLALQNDDGLYLFFLAGKRHQKYCPPGELFYGGIGGHLEEGEDLLACAHREAKEEIRADIEILPSTVSWYVSPDFTIEQLELKDKPQPYAFYKHVHPPEISRVSRYYHIVIYKARLTGLPGELPQDELQGIIALTFDQLVYYLDRKPTIEEMICDGVHLIGGERLDRRLQLYSLGTPRVLAHIFRHISRLNNI